MNQLLVKQPLNIYVTKEEFREDLNCLFANLKGLYGMYTYLGEDKFQRAYSNMQTFLDSEHIFDFRKSLLSLKRNWSLSKMDIFILERI